MSERIAIYYFENNEITQEAFEEIKSKMRITGLTRMYDEIEILEECEDVDTVIEICENFGGQTKD